MKKTITAVRITPAIVAIIFFMAWFVLLSAQKVNASALSTLAASMIPGQWQQLTTTYGGGITSSIWDDGGSGGYATQFTDKAVWDSFNKRIYFLGQAHQAIAGTLKSSIGPTDTTIPIDDTTRNSLVSIQPLFPGFYEIESEFVNFSGISGSSGSYALTGVNRGLGGSTAVAHTAGVATAWRDGGRFLKYDDATNTWTKLDSAVKFMYTQGREGIVHAYEHAVVVPGVNGKIFYREYNIGNVATYDINTDTWSSTFLPNYNSVVQCCSGFTYFPDRNELVMVDGDWGIFVWKFATGGSWTQIASTNGGGMSPQLKMGSSQNFAQYSRKCRCVVFGGGSSDASGTHAFYKYNADGSLSGALALSPLSAMAAGETMSDTIDPASGNLLFTGRDASSNLGFWEYDPVANTWTQKGSGQNPPWFTTNIGPDGSLFGKVAIPISDYGVTVWINYLQSGATQIWVYKNANASAFTLACADVMVIRCVGFDSTSDISGIFGDATGHTNGTASGPVIDTSVFSSGTGSMRFDIPASGGSDTSGSYFANFYDDHDNQAMQFGQGQSFFYQFQERFSSSFLTDGYFNNVTSPSATMTPSATTGNITITASSGVFTTAMQNFLVTSDAGGIAILTNIAADNVSTANAFVLSNFPNTNTIGASSWHVATTMAWKQGMSGTGDSGSCNSGNTTNCSTSCSTLELVINSYGLRNQNFPAMYNDCGTSLQFTGLYEPFGVGDFKLQNAIASPFCLFSQANAIPPTEFNPGQCVPYFANEWLTFKVQVTVGTWTAGSPPKWVNSNVKLWMAREGQAFVKLIDFTTDLIAGTTATAEKYGKVWLLPYMTGRDPAAIHQAGAASVWFDNLIISSQDIGSTPPSPPVTTPVVLRVGSGKTVHVGPGKVFKSGTH